MNNKRKNIDDNNDNNKKIKLIKLEECCICLEDIYESELKTLECNHIFHNICIKNINKCPLCRAIINDNIQISSGTVHRSRIDNATLNLSIDSSDPIRLSNYVRNYNALLLLNGEIGITYNR